MNILNTITNLKIKSLYEEPNYTPRDLLDHIAIGAIIKNDLNQILLFDHVKFNFWTIPVGKAEEGYTAEQGLKQELFEELGIKVLSSKLLHVNKRTYLRNNTNVNVNEHLFEVLSYKGTPRNLEPAKHRSIKWFYLEEIKKLSNLSNMTKMMLQIYK